MNKFQEEYPRQEHQQLVMSSIDRASSKALSERSANPYRSAVEARTVAIQFLQSYSPLDPDFPTTKLMQSQHLKAKAFKTCTFFGEFHNGKKSGWGVMVYQNSRVYEGHWDNDVKQGEAIQKYPNGAVFQGSFEQGKPQGQGKYFWPNGEYYEGQWRQGERHGSGIWTSPQGESYSGDWRLGKPEGYGLYTCETSIYEGEFKESLRHGQGVEKFSNGDMYRGRYQNGKPSGEGSYYWFDGSYFKGHFLNGCREGKGLWKKGVGNTDKYEGNYRNDMKWGYGQFVWASGTTYKGSYEADVRNGYGQIYWAEGGFYKGQWVDGLQTGEGKLHLPEEGLRVGEGELHPSESVLLKSAQESFLQHWPSQEAVSWSNQKVQKGNSSRRAQTIEKRSIKGSDRISFRSNKIKEVKIVGDTVSSKKSFKISQSKRKFTIDPGRIQRQNWRLPSNDNGYILEKKKEKSCTGKKGEGPPKRQPESQAKPRVLHSCYRLYQCYMQRERAKPKTSHSRT